MPRGELLGSLGQVGYFNKVCTIQQNVGVRDAAGQRAQTWQNLAGHIDIPCRKGTSGGRGTGGDYERESASQTESFLYETIILEGNFPMITTKHAAIVDGVLYDIEGVQHASDDSFTQLAVQVME